MNQVPTIPNPAQSVGSTLRDLLDLLWTEDLAGLRTQCLLTQSDGQANIALGETNIIVHLQTDEWRGGLRPVRIQRFETGRDFEPEELLRLVLDSSDDVEPSVRVRTLQQLNESMRNIDLVRQVGPTLANIALQEESHRGNLVFERLAAWGDRPFHPMSHSRGGWGETEIQQYGAEFGRLFPLSWYAVEKGRLIVSPQIKDASPAIAILNDAQLAAVNTQMQTLGIAGTHVAIPVHPWQADHVIGRIFADELTSRTIIQLSFRGPLVAATSSLRSVVVPSRMSRHIKLPLDVETLGVRRLLSAQSLMNGLKGAELLSAAFAYRPRLGEVARLADESQFWSFSEESKDVLAPRTAYLGCVIRDLPDAAEVTIMPLASLAVAPNDDVPPAIATLLQILPDITIEAFLAKLFDLLSGFAVEALSCGFIPEMHGQNVLIEMTGGLPSAIVLRDHDTVRCLPDVLKQCGLKVPDYIIKDPRRATMLLSRTEDLFAYGQTLLFDVAMRAVCEALDKAGAMDLATSRQMLRASVNHHLEQVEIPANLRVELRRALLEERQWPFKQILTPLLKTVELGLGMPSRVGLADNPLRIGG
jgi:siderophore synthetase component